MNLFTRLQAHHQAGKTIPIAMIGAGKFATMFLAQLRKLPAIHLACLVDLNPEGAKQNLALAGWPEEGYDAADIDTALRDKTICVSDDWQAAIDYPGIEIIIEVNNINHPHTPKTFNKGTKMYKTSSNYASCNWLNGIPLWDNKEEEITKELKPSCQVNYGFIKRLL